ncbi:uncharacterized protein LOC141641342 [Silene latifolia]|uniref:uncharacterized protein LOC141641342 n=1 Tax=Silene latifolia TaxID=37657 RepID=UPI003D77F84D
MVVMAEKRKQVLVPTQPKKRGYISWNSQMDALLISVLYNQVSQGNKGDGDWKPQAYQAVVDEVRSKLNVSVTTENVRNRVRIWRRHYGTIMEIRTKTKFKWDEERKMVLVSRDDEDEWDTYIKCEQFKETMLAYALFIFADKKSKLERKRLLTLEANSPASSYANKYIEHWDDISILLGPDRAVGDGGEHYEEGATMMDEEACDASTSSIDTTSTSSKKKRKSDSLADAVTQVANTLQSYVEARLKSTPTLGGKEVFDEVSKVVGILRPQILQAVNVFVEASVKFQVLKDLPSDQKLDWILLCLDERNRAF